MNSLKVINEREVLGKEFRIYGDIENPKFLAKDVAEWIEHSDVSMMLKKIDEDEKLIQTIFVSGQNREMWFLTEDGLYEVLMQSRKPIAKQFKKEVKNILKQIRKTGGYVANDDKFIETYLPFADDSTKMLFKGTLEILNKQNKLIEDQKNALKEGEQKVIEAKEELSKVQIELKEKIRTLLDGNDKTLNLTQLVSALEIPRLTSTIFNQWLCSKGFGNYVRFEGDKNRTFQPNERFKKYIAGEGYCFTGTTNDKSKIVINYTMKMVDRIIDKHYNEICDLVLEKNTF